MRGRRLRQERLACWFQFRHGATAIRRAGNAANEAAPLQPLDRPREPARTQPDGARQPGHALRAPRIAQRAQQLELAEWQPVGGPQRRVKLARDGEVGEAQATPDRVAGRRRCLRWCWLSSRVHG